MAISYNRLWKLLIDKNMTKTDLRNITGMNSVTLANNDR
ncbi:helix-turn-helix domain-containing protein [Metamycoplasma equirhinis]